MNTPIVDGGENIDTILGLIAKLPKLIVSNFDKITHIDTLYDAVQKHKTRIIATSPKNIFNKTSDKFFSLSIKLPPLRDRKEDIYPLAKKFLEDAKKSFALENINIKIDKDKLDISRNCYSLKLSVYKLVVEEIINENDIMQILQNLFSKRLGSGNDYRNNLYIYEIPLIKAALAMFKSQLKVSENFGINRNTLRKKINEYNIS